MAVSKQYRCPLSNYALPCTIAGKTRWLRFYGSQSKGGYYNTMNVAEQRCIESSKAFLRGEITLEGTYPVDDVEVVSEQVVENKETIMVEGITTVQAAREYLVESKGAKASELNNREAVLAYAERVGVKFAEL